MSDINWEDGAVCYADERQYKGHCKYLELLIKYSDFKLNEIRIGDYIEAQELDTEQKYNDVVDVFRLFGFEFGDGAEHRFSDVELYGNLTICHDGIYATELTQKWCKRKLTYSQIMAIGKLKRMMLECEKSAPETTPNLTADSTKVTANKYEREITDRQGNSATVDVYDVLKAFEVTCPATQHAVKKLLCTGARGHKDLETDLIEAKESITRAIELNR